MGQYYRAASIERKEYVEPHDYDNFNKIMEHSYVNNEYVEIVGQLLLEDNDWYKTEISWCGDYTTVADYTTDKLDKELKNTAKGLYKDKEYSEYYKERYEEKYGEYTLENVQKNTNLDNIIERCFKRITPELIKENTIRYYFNDTKKEYIDIADCIANGYGYKIHPLPLLVCTCNHSGGSYYEKEGKEYISTWKGDIIFSARTLDNINIGEYKLIKPGFIEH